MKQLFLAILALSIAAFTPVNSHHCKELRDGISQPVQNVLSYLQMKPDLEALSGPGCLYILQQLKTLPSSAEMIRQLGTQKAVNVSSQCLYQVNSIHYPCVVPRTGEARCLPQTYSYCGQWAYSMTNETHYEAIMELSMKVDSAYDRAQKLCGFAMSYSGAAAQAATRELEVYLENEVIPRDKKVYEMSCGD